MEEYEYSYYVKDINPYIEFCEKNNYKKICEVSQHRKVFENQYNRDIISRITTENDITVIDFKNVNNKKNELNISNESKTLKVDENNEAFINSMLTTLGFELCADNYRIRYVYKKENVKFEIDKYTSPEEYYVVGVEGDRLEVDKVFKELEDINNEYKINEQLKR